MYMKHKENIFEIMMPFFTASRFLAYEIYGSSETALHNRDSHELKQASEAKFVEEDF